MSSPSDKASKQAQANEQARQANVSAGTQAINSYFDSPQRTSAYDKLASDTTAYYKLQADKQQDQANRNLRFALARSGQAGGSVQADQGEKLGQDYSNAILEATRRGQQAGASLRSQDESERASLTAAVQGGLDATTAASNAESAARANLASATANSTNNALSDAFGDFANLYQNSKDAAALRSGMKYSYNTLYQPGFGAGSGMSTGARFS